MTSTKKPKGYVDKVLFIDAETSGIAFGSDDPSEYADGGRFQAVSWGIVVADANTLKEIESLYVEVKWDGETTWSKEAQNVHGLSPAYLEQNGLDEEDAVVEIAGLILKYWGPDTVVQLGGHNVATFDKYFFSSMMKRHGLRIKFGSKCVDSYSIGFATFGIHNSDDLFESVGLPARAEHNSLIDAQSSLAACRIIRTIFQQAIA